jgi:hypothetical protein
VAAVPRLALRFASVGVVLAASAIAAASAVAASPADGGYGVVSPLEQRLGEIATRLSGRDATVYCNAPAQWRRWRTTYGWRGDTVVLAFVPRTQSGLAGFMHVSPEVCAADNRFLASPRRRGQKECAARAASRGRTTPRRRLCGGYRDLVDSIETIAHEAAHVAGIDDEGVAECAALQTTAFVAAGLGASGTFAREIGRDYLPLYRALTAGAPDYAADGCFDGGRYDLWPDRAGWPTPPGAPAPDYGRLLSEH